MANVVLITRAGPTSERHESLGQGRCSQNETIIEQIAITGQNHLHTPQVLSLVCPWGAVKTRSSHPLNQNLLAQLTQMHRQGWKAPAPQGAHYALRHSCLTSLPATMPRRPACGCLQLWDGPVPTWQAFPKRKASSVRSADHHTKIREAGACFQSGFDSDGQILPIFV